MVCLQGENRKSHSAIFVFGAADAAQDFLLTKQKMQTLVCPEFRTRMRGSWDSPLVLLKLGFALFAALKIIPDRLRNRPAVRLIQELLRRPLQIRLQLGQKCVVVHLDGLSFVLAEW